MIKKLYNCGCFDYKKFILENQKKLSLTNDEAIVLISILDDYPKTNRVSIESIINNVNMSEDNLAETLANLMEKEFYSIYISYDNGIGNENASFDSFFNKVSSILENKNNDSNNEIFLATNFLNKSFNRLLKPLELDILSALIYEERHTLKEIMDAVDRIKSNNRLLTMKSLSLELNIKEEKPLKPNTSGVLKDFMRQIK